MERLYCLIIGYILGALIQSGYWIGKFHHIDIRNYGSGNAGATNVLRTMGKKSGILTYSLDALKPIFAAIIVYFLFKNTDIPMFLLFMYSGLGAVLGHDFPFYLKFKGGKGVATTSGAVMCLTVFPKYCWSFVALGLIIFIIIEKTTRYVSLGSLVIVSVWFLQFCIWTFFGLLPLTGLFACEGCIAAFIMTFLVFIRHKANIVRLKNGTERKLGEKK